MGMLEQESRIRTRNTKITRAIISILAVAVAGALNPQGLVRGVLRSLNSPASKRRASESAIYAARRRLAKQGLIEYRGSVWRITERGRRALQTMQIGTTPLPRPRKWDKKWRILVFDIREERKVLRDKIRRTLISLGFCRLQDSVWVYPYDCEDLIALLKTDFRVGKDLLYIIADTVENDSWLRKQFQLR